MVQVWTSIGKFFRSIGQDRIRVNLWDRATSTMSLCYMKLYSLILEWSKLVAEEQLELFFLASLRPGRLFLLRDSLWHTVSCRIPFSRFLSHFHYCSLLSRWYMAARSALTLSFLPRLERERERVANHLSSLPLTHSGFHTWALLGPLLLLKWTWNRSVLDRAGAQKIESRARLRLHGNGMKLIFISCTWRLRSYFVTFTLSCIHFWDV